jgi:type 1 glutamine amidotransferase
MNFIGYIPISVPKIKPVKVRLSFWLMSPLLLSLVGPPIWGQSPTTPRLLIFSGISTETTTIHAGIQYGLELIKGMAPKSGFIYDTTTKASDFTDENLKKYQAVFMNNTCRGSGIFNSAQRASIEKFVSGGGGWAANHCSAAMTVGAWPWYERLTGAIHRQHTPGSKKGVIRVDDRIHSSTKHLPGPLWNIANEELYYFRNVPTPSWRPNPTLPTVHVLLTFQSWEDNGIIQTKPHGSEGDSSHMGALAWYHEFEGGRSWYSALGHEQAVYKDSLFIKHLIGGLKYVLKIDSIPATLGLVDRNRMVHDVHASKAFIKSIRSDSHSYILQDFQVFDIQGSHSRSDLGWCKCERASAKIRVVVPEVQ